jgi:multidrug resistance efflux pump
MTMLGTMPILASLLLAAAPTSGNQPSAATHAHLTQCVVSLIEEVELPARVAGVLMTLEVEVDGEKKVVSEGLKVAKDQILGKLDNAEAVARRQAAELDHQVARAEEKKSEASIQAADATVLVAGAEVEESLAINQKARGAVAPTQLRRQRLTEDRAKVEANVARRDAETATLTVQLRGAQIEVASINLDRHNLVSPLNGYGEWVNPGDPILRIVHTDRLRVEGFVNIRDYRPQEIDGCHVEIAVRLKDRVETFDSIISHVSYLVDTAGDYRVWAEVDNREVDGHPLLLPGMTADMSIELKSLGVAATR